jgi:hypothetical protein
MGIKSKLLSLTVTVIFLGTIFGIFINGASAEEDRAEISFKSEPTYILTDEITRNGRVIGRTYEINIVLQNTGSKKLDELTVNITDEEGFSLKKLVDINPSETETITFTWSTLLLRTQKITVNYFPSSSTPPSNSYNTGKTAFSIIMEEDEGVTATSTPGFEFLITILSLLSLIITIRKPKQNR